MPFSSCLIFFCFILKEISLEGVTFSDLNSEEGNTNREPGFYRDLAELNFGNEDVVSMFQNLAASEETARCSRKCRTPISLWMLRPVEPCDQLIKADCPPGLVCCGSSQAKSSILPSSGGIGEGFYIPDEDLSDELKKWRPITSNF